MKAISNRLRAYAKAVSQAVLVKRIAGRELTVFPDNVFLVSYLRSGSTWARFLVGNLIHSDEPITFANVNFLMPMIYDFPDRILRSLRASSRAMNASIHVIRESSTLSAIRATSWFLSITTTSRFVNFPMDSPWTSS